MPPQQPARPTQSFVHTLSTTWSQPSLTALEIAWRWLFGIPATLLLYSQIHKALLNATAGTLDPARLGLDKSLLNDPVGSLSADPLAAASKFSGAITTLEPYMAHFAIWLIPLLVAAWIIISVLGRTLVLRRADPAIHARPITLIVLQTLRTAALFAVFVLWYRAMAADAAFTVNTPVAHDQDPNLILYCAFAIVLTIGLFTAWGFVSWIFTIAPLLSMLSSLGVRASLVAALTLGPLKGRLIEINLVLGVVKIALIVLALVFSATPLPFESVTTPAFLACWWAGVTILYLLWSDFFHVARLLGYLALWKANPLPEIPLGNL
jgi:hypothetical protein